MYAATVKDGLVSALEYLTLDAERERSSVSGSWRFKRLYSFLRSGGRGGRSPLVVRVKAVVSLMLRYNPKRRSGCQEAAMLKLLLKEEEAGRETEPCNLDATSITVHDCASPTLAICTCTALRDFCNLRLLRRRSPHSNIQH